MDPAQFRGEWDRTRLPPNVRIGPRTFIERWESFEHFRSEREPGLVLGADVRVYTWTEFSVERDGIIEIGDRSLIVGAAFMCAERITIGREVLISYRVTIMDSDFHALDSADRQADAIANAPDASVGSRPRPVARPVTIGDGVRIGIGAIILKGVSIGSKAWIRPGSVVTRNVPSGATWAGILPDRSSKGRSAMSTGQPLEHDWLDAPLPDNVRLGEGSWVHSAFAFHHCRSERPLAVAIGDHSGVYIGTMFELGPNGQVTIGRHCSVVAAIIATNASVDIGDRTFIAHEVVIADDGYAHPPNEGIDGGAAAGPTLGRDVWVGMRSTILGPVTIGDGAVIAAGTVITEDVAPFTVVAGDPPRVIRQLQPST